MKRLEDMTYEEIVKAAIEERGLDPENKDLWKQYPLSLIERVRKGDLKALKDFIRIAPRRMTVSQ